MFLHHSSVWFCILTSWICFSIYRRKFFITKPMHFKKLWSCLDYLGKRIPESSFQVPRPLPTSVEKTKLVFLGSSRWYMAWVRDIHSIGSFFIKVFSINLSKRSNIRSVLVLVRLIGSSIYFNVIFWLKFFSTNFVVFHHYFDICKEKKKDII